MYSRNSQTWFFLSLATSSRQYAAVQYTTVIVAASTNDNSSGILAQSLDVIIKEVLKAPFEQTIT